MIEEISLCFSLLSLLWHSALRSCDLGKVQFPQDKSSAEIVSPLGLRSNPRCRVQHSHQSSGT